MRYDTERKERTRTRVLAEAAKAIRAEGPANLGVAQVMARAGLTHGGFYAHFGSRDELVAEAITETFKDANRLIDRAMREPSPREALAAYITAYLSTRHRDRRETGCPLSTLASDLPRLPANARERFAEGIGQITARLRGFLDAAGVEGTETLASSVMAELVGAISLARILPDSEQSATFLAHCREVLLGRLGLGDLA